jgi:adenylylsulfate kinase
MLGPLGAPGISFAGAGHRLSRFATPRSIELRKPAPAVWITGLPAAGKTTLAHELAAALREQDLDVEVLDGDEFRRDFSPELGFARADRDLNVKRLAMVSALLARHGVIAVVAAVSPYRAGRQLARTTTSGPFIEVFLDTPLDICVARDPKGLYRRATTGELTGVTGVDAPYEAPEAPEIHLRGGEPMPNAKTICSEILRRSGLEGRR